MIAGPEGMYVSLYRSAATGSSRSLLEPKCGQRQIVRVVTFKLSSRLDQQRRSWLIAGASSVGLPTRWPGAIAQVKAPRRNIGGVKARQRLVRDCHLRQRCQPSARAEGVAPPAAVVAGVGGGDQARDPRAQTRSTHRTSTNSASPTDAGSAQAGEHRIGAFSAAVRAQ
jgi:hypothetical protein